MFEIPEYKQKIQELPTFSRSLFFNNKPHRVAIIGKSGGGKTRFIPNIVGHMLPQKNSELIAFVKDKQDRNYNNISMYCKENSIPCTILDTFDECLIDSCKNKKIHSIIIFDDIDLDKNQLKSVDNLFSKGRQDSITSIIVGQDYFNRISKQVRDNINLLCLFDVVNKQDITRMGNAIGIDKNDVIKYHKHCMQNDEFKPLILYPDCGPNSCLKIRHGIDGILKKYII